jgi:hypothetical protein
MTRAKLRTAMAMMADRGNIAGDIAEQLGISLSTLARAVRSPARPNSSAAERVPVSFLTVEQERRYGRDLMHNEAMIYGYARVSTAAQDETGQAVEETDQRGRTRRTTEARDRRRGIPQGSPLSPLLANLYMRRFVLGWKKLGLTQSLGTRLVIYADDLVILCRRGSAEKALYYLREIMGQLKLTVNEEKTRICRVPDGEFDFLGYTFGQMYSPVTGKARLGQRPSKKSLKRMVERVHALTVRAAT